MADQNHLRFLPKLFRKVLRKKRQLRKNYLATFELLERRDVFAAATLVHDINAIQDSNSLALQMSEVAAFGSSGYFSSTTLDAGSELWRTDGTQAGTYLVKDLQPGQQSSNPNSFFEFQGSVYFAAALNDGYFLFRTDGTSAGTVPIALTIGQKPLVLGNRIYFGGYDEANGTELWSSDGTPQGSGPVADLFPGIDGSSPNSLTQQGSKVLFQAYGPSGPRLYSFDTVSKQMTILNENLTSVNSLKPFGAKTLVVTGGELWTTDGTIDGTEKLLNSGQPIVAIAANGSVQGKVILESNGLNGMRIEAVGATGFVNLLIEFPYYAAITYSAEINSQVLFSAYNYNDGARSMYLTDGTASGTVLVSTPTGFSPNMELSVVWNDDWYFPGYQFSTSSSDLWKYSPNSNSLTRLDDGSASLPSDLTKPVVTGNGLYWGDNLQSPANVSFLRRTADGINVTTSSTAFDGLYGVRALSVLNNNVTFAGVTSQGLALRTTADTEVSSLTPNVPGVTYGAIDTSNYSTRPASLNGKKYFFADSDNQNGNELWRTDGTSAGTIQIADVDFGYTTRLIATTNNLYVFGESNAGVSLWSVNETTPGVDFVTTFATNLVPTAVLGDRIVLTDSNNGLWVSDGTSDGTVLVTTLYGNLYQPVVVGQTVYFSGNNSDGQRCLWKSDGTALGTVIAATGLGANWYQVTTDGSSIFWASSDDGYTLWRSDDGLQTRQQIGKSVVHDLSAVGGLLYYVRWIDSQYADLYRTDSSIGGPQRVGQADTLFQFAPKLLPVGGNMSVVGLFGGQFQVWSDIQGDQFAYDDELSSLANLSVWGDPELNGNAIAPTYFSQFGSELGKLDVASRISISNRVIVENAAPAMVGILSANWNPNGTPTQFSLVAGLGDSDNSLFSITPAGELRADVSFDSDIQAKRTVRIRATSGSSVLAEQNISLFVRDLFDGVELVSLNGNVVAENSPVGTAVGTLSAQSLPNTTVTYSVLSVDGASTNLPFAVNGNRLLVAGPLDFETNRTRSVVIRTLASDGKFANETFAIQLTNINENASASIRLSKDSVLENEPGIVGALSVPNSNATWTFSFVSGAGAYDNNLFAISGGQLVLLDIPDYETRDNYSVRVIAQDGLVTIAAALTVDITPVDEFDPTDFFFVAGNITSDLPFLFENVPIGTPATRIKVEDRDRGETYTLTGNFSDLATISGDAFVPIRSINFEEYANPNNFYVNLNVLGSGGRSYSRSYGTSLILDVNDPPVVTTPKLDEDIVAGVPSSFSVPVGSFFDEDRNDRLTVTATLNGSALPAWLTFDPQTGSFGANPTSSQIGIYSVIVNATDLAGAVVSNTFTLTVLNANFVQANGTAGNDTLNVIAQNAAGTQWTVTLNGTQIFAGDLTLRPLQFSGNAGTDRVIVQATVGSETISIRDNQITVGQARIFLNSVESQDIRGRGGNDTFRVLTTSSSTTRAPQTGILISGGAGIDTLIGAAGTNEWTITDSGEGTLNAITFTQIENLIGNSALDHFVIGPRGSVAGQIDGGGGYNALEYSNRDASIDVQVNTISPTSGSAASIDGFTNLNAISIQSTRSSTFTGPGPSAVPSGRVTWEASQAQAVLLAGKLLLSGFDRLDGSAANDEFYLSDYASLYEIDGRGGIDKIQLQGNPTLTNINLDDRTGSGIRRFDGIETFVGNGSESALRGPSQDTQWIVTSQGTVTNSKNYTFQGFGRILGGSGNDSFDLQPNSPPITLAGGGGMDTLRTLDALDTNSEASWDLTGRGRGSVQSTTFEGFEKLVAGTDHDNFVFQTTPPSVWFDSINSSSDRYTWITYSSSLPGEVGVEVNLQERSATGIREWNNVQAFFANTGSDRLIGRNAIVRWQIDMSGNLSSDGILSFQGFETIAAGSGDDTMNFVPDGNGEYSNGPKRITGGNGSNTLLFTLFPVPVTIDLQTGAASPFPLGIASFQNITGSAFDDSLSGDSNDNIFFGYLGNDTLRGLAGDDVLMGGGGNDSLYGGSGNDLLIGGTGGDNLYGGTGDDLLIAGFSNLFLNEGSSEPEGVHLLAIQVVMNEWTSNRSYAQRITRLQSGVGANNSIRLNATSITADSSIDYVFGEGNDDWFWLGSNDLAPDLNPLRERRN